MIRSSLISFQYPPVVSKCFEWISIDSTGSELDLIGSAPQVLKSIGDSLLLGSKRLKQDLAESGASLVVSICQILVGSARNGLKRVNSYAMDSKRLKGLLDICGLAPNTQIIGAPMGMMMLANWLHPDCSQKLGKRRARARACRLMH